MFTFDLARFRYHRCNVVCDHDHHIHVRPPDHPEEGVHILLVDALPVRGHVRADVTARIGPNHRAAKVLEILHRARYHIYPGQSGQPAHQVHGAGHLGDGAAAVRRAQG